MLYVTLNPWLVCAKELADKLCELDHNYKKHWLHLQDQLEKVFSADVLWELNDLIYIRGTNNELAQIKQQQSVVTDWNRQQNLTGLCSWSQRLTYLQHQGTFNSRIGMFS